MGLPHWEDLGIASAVHPTSPKMTMSHKIVTRTPYRCAVGLMIKTDEVSEQVCTAALQVMADRKQIFVIKPGVEFYVNDAYSLPHDPGIRQVRLPGPSDIFWADKDDFDCPKPEPTPAPNPQKSPPKPTKPK